MSDSSTIAREQLKIRSVNLKESKVSVQAGIDITDNENFNVVRQTFRGVNQVHGSELKATDDKDDQATIFKYQYIYGVGLRLVLPEDEEVSHNEDYEPVLEITCEYCVNYFSNVQLDEGSLKAYANDNVGYHVWPYWREYVQSSCARIGLNPPLEIPVYILSNNEVSNET